MGRTDPEEWTRAWEELWADDLRMRQCEETLQLVGGSLEKPGTLEAMRIGFALGIFWAREGRHAESAKE